MSKTQQAGSRRSQSRRHVPQRRGAPARSRAAVVLLTAALTASCALGAETLDDSSDAAVTALASAADDIPVAEVRDYPWCLDIDGNRVVEAARDGVLLIRWLFGFRGAELVDGAFDPQGTRATPAAIAAQLALPKGPFDLDLDGHADALTDGLLAWRWLSGRRGADLIQNALGQGARRTDAVEISAVLATAVAQGCHWVSAVSELDRRVSELADRAAKDYQPDDDCRTETDLDGKDYQDINAIQSDLKPFDDPQGWFCEARTGGRPFRCMDRMRSSGQSVAFDPTLFHLDGGAEGGLTPAILARHFAAGRTVNKLWCGRNVDGDWLTMVVINADGNINIAGSGGEMNLGAALRSVLAGTPFSGNADIEVDIDDIALEGGGEQLQVVFNASSSAFEAALWLVLDWSDDSRSPVIDIESHILSRQPMTGGFGFNFMKGGVLFGRNDPLGRGGIASFHDARSAFVLDGAGALLKRIRFVPPNDAQLLPTSGHCGSVGVPFAEFERVLHPSVAPVELILDQFQTSAGDYYSKQPTPSYGERTDLHLAVLSTDAGLELRRAQASVDYSCVNPEAAETTNLYF